VNAVCVILCIPMKTSDFPQKNTSNKHGGFWSALSERLGLKSFSYPVPVHAQSLPYMLGGLSLAAFGILFVSGIYLAQFYNPNQVTSNQSIFFLVTQVPFGNFVRSIHFWTANIVFLLIILHLIRAFISGSYKRPREGTWLMGLGLLAVTMAFIFAGTIMSSTQEGIEALQHAGEMGFLLGNFGIWLTAGFSASLPFVGEMYVAHISILVIFFLVFIIAHFYFIKVHGISPKATHDAVIGKADKEKQSYFSEHVKKLIGWSFILFAIISAISLVFPESLGGVGLAGVEMTKPPWMFLWLFGMEDVFGITSLLWGPLLLFTLLALIPFFDRSRFLSPRRRPWTMIFGLAIAFSLIALSVNAMLAPIGKKIESKNSTLTFLQIFSTQMVYAHNMPFLSFSPVVAKLGSKITISADGLKEGGTYKIYLKGPRANAFLGTVKVKSGDDSFDTTVDIPLHLAGDMYSVEIIKNIGGITSKKGNNKFFAPLQLAVQPFTPLSASQILTKKKYPIHKNEQFWIIALIIISFGIGVSILTIHTKEEKNIS